MYKNVSDNMFQIFAETIKNATEANYLNVTITINPGGKTCIMFL